MKDFITALDPNYQLDKYHIKNNVAVFYISSKMSEAKCPYCGTLLNITVRQSRQSGVARATCPD